MSIFLYTLLAFCLFFFLLAIGYIIQHKMIHGSCGGLNSVGIERSCSCEKPCFSRRIKNHFAKKNDKTTSNSNSNETNA